MSTRLDHVIIRDLVPQGASVLDLGCGDGELMALLARERGARVQGIELDEEAIQRCVEKGLTVFQGDIESGLVDYPDGSFDVVILNQSMQQVKKVDFVIRESLRVGALAIVGFPNFAHIGARATIFFRGRTPVTDALPYSWEETPNVRFLSIKDFRDFCSRRGIRVLVARFTTDGRRVWLLPNLLAASAIFVFSLGGREVIA
jgi:methionine biosynthesis protein MetW